MLSPQIYIAKFDKTLTFKPLDYTSHKVSSLVIAGTKAKARKGGKTRVKRGKTLHTETRSERAKNEGKKRCEKRRCYDRKNDNFCNMQS